MKKKIKNRRGMGGRVGSIVRLGFGIRESMINDYTSVVRRDRGESHIIPLSWAWAVIRLIHICSVSNHTKPVFFRWWRRHLYINQPPFENERRTSNKIMLGPLISLVCTCPKGNGRLVGPMPFVAQLNALKRHILILRIFETISVTRRLSSSRSSCDISGVNNNS